MYIILVYDISIEEKGSRRWRNIFKICKHYLNHVQNSVFEGEISKADLLILKDKLHKELDKNIDSIIIFKSRNKKWLDKEILGLEINDSNFI